MSLREFISGLDLRKKKIVDSCYIIDKDSIFNLDLLFGFNMGLEYKSRVLNYARIKKLQDCSIHLLRVSAMT